MAAGYLLLSFIIPSNYWNTQFLLLSVLGWRYLGNKKSYQGSFNLDQVSSHLGNLVERERAMTRLLNNGPEEHLDLVEKMQKGLKVALNICLILLNFLVDGQFFRFIFNMKVAQKNSSNLLKELATLEAAKIKADKPKFCVVHK